ncbi:universal stress protein [Paractinoplanes brasiliensis]|uniref:Nucleotide-binding universal stress UspA family protein n=1 Tax=Paractinoplanes brasiliensis TaxID=52695 RepID=A0A4R6J8M4_9ACTN|nr:universal stress protein [Actinoplanes brasiliensis]TDO31812.1 nucleotide-binding universal stress UspA family protein [Actinoplanes brasiliensis]GID30590.1 universal stress protein [Actinoplanes brasiliensis]
MIKTRLVVGVDGSAEATAAVSWAAAEAVRRHAELRLLTAYYRHRSTPGRPGSHSAEEHAATVLRRAAAHAREAAGEVEIKCQSLPGYAVPLLVHAAEEAALLVVGGRHEGGLPVLPVGSVSNQVATQARSSVVVVRGRYGPGAGPVVAALDDGPAATTVLGHAFEEAALHGVELEALTVGGTAAPDPLGAELDAQLDRWREKYPGVRARREYLTGRPDLVLTQRSRSACLMVVGPRTHGFQGLMLGPIGTRLLHHAACPVLVAR